MSMRQIYRKIARENGVSLAEVKRDMQEAINHAYQRTPNDCISEAYQNQIPRKGAIPTVEDVVRFTAKKINNDHNK